MTHDVSVIGLYILDVLGRPVDAIPQGGGVVVVEDHRPERRNQHVLQPVVIGTLRRRGQPKRGEGVDLQSSAEVLGRRLVTFIDDEEALVLLHPLGSNGKQERTARSLRTFPII